MGPTWKAGDVVVFTTGTGVEHEGQVMRVGRKVTVLNDLTVEGGWKLPHDRIRSRKPAGQA